MAKVIGIDLGTTNLCVSIFERGESKIIPNKDWTDSASLGCSARESSPEEDRNVLLELVPQIQQVANDGFVAFTEKSIANAESIGCEFNDDVDIAAFKERVKPLIESTVNENDVRKALYAAIQEA